MTVADRVSSERQTRNRNTRPAGNLAGQSDKRIVPCGDMNGPDKAVSDDATELPPSLQDDDVPLDDDASSAEPYSSPLET